MSKQCIVAFGKRRRRRQFSAIYVNSLDEDEEDCTGELTALLTAEESSFGMDEGD